MARYNALFYIVIFLIILSIFLTIYFVRKLKYSFKEFIISLKIPAIILVVLEIITFFVILFLYSGMTCKIGAHCPTASIIFIRLLPYTLIGLLMIILPVYYLIKLLRKK